MSNHRIATFTVVATLVTASHGQNFFQRSFGPLTDTGAFNVVDAVRHANGSWVMRTNVPGDRTILGLEPDGTNDWITRLSSPQFNANGEAQVIASGPGNGSIVVLGDTMVSVSANVSRRHFDLVGLGSAGNLLWSTRHYFDIPAAIYLPNYFHDVASTPTGGLYVDGGEPELPAIFKFNSNGVTEWGRALSGPTPVGNISDMIPDGNGGCYFLADGQRIYDDSSRFVIGRLNANGTLAWCKTAKPAQSGRVIDPKNVILRANGHLLLLGLEYGAGEAWDGILLEMNSDGGPVWMRTYSAQDGGSMDLYSVRERSDGRLWMDFQDSGYGFILLNSDGTIDHADRFMYQPVGGGYGVVAWSQTLMYNDELGVVGAYFIDYEWQPDPRTEWLWNLDAMDPDFCGMEPVTVASFDAQLNELVFEQGFSVSVLNVGDVALSVQTSTVDLPPSLSSCSIILGSPEVQAQPMLLIAPNVLSEGMMFTVQADGLYQVQVFDLTGRAVVSAVTPGHDQLRIGTSGWSTGIHTVRAYDERGGILGVGRVVVE